LTCENIKLPAPPVSHEVGIDASITMAHVEDAVGALNNPEFSASELGAILGVQR
jgi:hypothetical protein